MTTISITPEPSTSSKKFRAVAGQRHSLGNTPGEALDAMTEQLGDDDSGTLLVVQRMKPDRYFTEAQRTRLADLMERWRNARDQDKTFPADEQHELDQLIATELEAATQRTKSLLAEIQI